MDSLGEALEVGEALLAKSRHFEALQHFSEILHEHPREVIALHGTCIALLGSVADGSISDSWDEAKRQRVYRTVILQEHIERGPPFLAKLIASRLSPGTSANEGIARLAQALIPTLLEIDREGHATKSFVVVLLLLREALGTSISQDRVRSYHLDWFARFTIDDLSLPYNCMFDTTRHRRNRAEIFAHLRADPALLRAGSPIPLTHFVVFEWLSGKPLAAAGRPVAELVAAKLSQLPGEALVAAAAKSLLVGQGASVDEIAVATAGSPEVQDGFGHLAASVAATRQALSSGLVPAPVRAWRLESRTWQAAHVLRARLARHAPFVARRGRRLKVALCVSGQLRGFRAAFASWERTFLPAVDATIFVHSWFGIGRSGAEPVRTVLPFEGSRFTAAYREACLRHGFGEVKERYPSFFESLGATGRITADEVAALYRTSHVRLDDDKLPPFAALSNQQKMHSKIEASFDLMRASGQEFDLIVRLRPDKPIDAVAFDWQDLRAACHAAPRLYADHAAGSQFSVPMIGDQFAVGAPGPMGVYARGWTLYPPLAAQGLLKCGPNFEGHVSLAQVCWAYGIDVRKMPMRFGSLSEAEPMAGAAIREQVARDAAGRMDETDRALLAAVDADLAS